MNIKKVELIGGKNNGEIFSGNNVENFTMDKSLIYVIEGEKYIPSEITDNGTLILCSENGYLN